MNTWIFQGVPEQFDIDGYLGEAKKSDAIVMWRVMQGRKRIAPGDQIFFWRARDKVSNQESGVIAFGVCLTNPRMTTFEKPEYVRTPITEPFPRVDVRLVEVRLTEHDAMLKRTTLQNDAVLSRMRLLLSPQGTNFWLSPVEAERMKSLWDNELRSDDIDGFDGLSSEGRRILRLHYRRERDRRLVDKKREAFAAEHGRLYCEACGFDFLRLYGELGNGAIEVHHKGAISDYPPDGGKTSLEDLAIVCANCHRVIHSRRPEMYSIDELRAAISSAT